MHSNMTRSRASEYELVGGRHCKLWQLFIVGKDVFGHVHDINCTATK